MDTIYDQSLSNGICLRSPPAPREHLINKIDSIAAPVEDLDCIVGTISPRSAPHMLPTQHSLIARLRGGDSDSDWNRFYALYEKPILAFAASHSLKEAECSDVLQETMVKMVRVGFARFDPAKGSFTGFLFNLAKCSVIDAIRRRNRSECRHVSLDRAAGEKSSPLGDQLADASGTPADAAERQGQMALVLLTLDLLIERKFFQARTVGLFKAVTIEQKDPKQVAQDFKTSVGNVYEAKRAVLTKLRSTLQGLEEGLDLDRALAG
ncbi:MAG: sigma-70 family RNA polymerase sigma factor [Chthoniobacterales bacterium]|nr:sigma-70 family RNA polymerase sigma factor [Chthoniobacterales bacterium]